MHSVINAWLQSLSTRLDSAKLNALDVDTPDGNISVVPCGDGEYLCKIRFPGNLGSRDIARTSIDHIFTLVQDQVVHGISFPPLYQKPNDDDVEEREGRPDSPYFRQILPEGELRIVAHQDGFIGLLVLPNSLRLLAWSDAFETALDASRQVIHTDATTRMSVRLRGRIRDLKLCSTDGILAHYSTDDLSIFLVPGTPFIDADGLWDAPVNVTVIRRDEEMEYAWTHPSFNALDGHNPVWSDEWSKRSHAAPDTPSRSSPARPHPPGPSPLDPDVVALLHRYLDTLDHTEGPGQSMRRQFAPILRGCAQSGDTDIRGCGRQLRAELVARGGAPLCGSDRAFRLAIAFFHQACPLLVQRVGNRETIFAISELRRGTALAAWLADKLAAHTPPLENRLPQDLADARPNDLVACDDPNVDAPTPLTFDPPPPAPDPASSARSLTARLTPDTDSSIPPPWVDERNTPALAASIARYLGPPNPRTGTVVSQLGTEPPAPPTGPPGAHDPPRLP